MINTNAFGRGLDRSSLPSLLVALTFCFLVLGFRLTLPFGDEPDFYIRSAELVDLEFPLWTPYVFVSEYLARLNINTICQMDVSPTSVWASIDSVSCSEDMGQVIFRSLLTLLVTSPLLLVVAWRSFGMGLLSLMVSDSSDGRKQRHSAFGLSLLIPGMIYNLGLLSLEQLTLVVSIFIFYFWGSWAIIFILVILVASIDLGNGVVVGAFVIFNVLIKSSLIGSRRKTSLGVLLLVVTVALFYGYEMLPYIQFISPLELKAESLYAKSVYADFLDKYPILLRPVITFMTGVFMTPAGVKVLPVYVIACVYLALLLYRLRDRWSPLYRSAPAVDGLERRAPDSQWLIAGVSALVTVLFFTLSFPDYSNAKYYIFMTPFVVRISLMVFSDSVNYLVFSGCSLSVLFALMLFST